VIKILPLIGLVILGLIPSAGEIAAPDINEAGPAHVLWRARGTSFSSNWSGYATYPAAAGTTFTEVEGRWTQPVASCPTGKKSYAAFWVGLDGYNSNTVEQIGTDSDCIGNNRASYYAWYEMYPNPPVMLTMPVHAGEAISAKVSASASAVTLTISNLTTGGTYTTTQTSNAAQGSSAEWVAEAPAQCSIFSCTVLPLTNFGSVNFTGSYTTANGHFGSIGDGAWNHDSVVMTTNSGTLKAQPSALPTDGTGFSVAWRHQ